MGNFDRGGRGNFGAPREMHKATCSECGKECEVPFKPTEGKPVYCRECYAKKRPY
ncbi:MAG: DNA-directed RNA polymerase [Candidatus ainarchaeum sp.]|nr:DNA-directed RNA polymerase [Candidatus ainarchaeum sp.]